jgi:dihydrofolate reductase
MNITGLMACTEKGVIGFKGNVPWRYPDELKHFQEITHNQIIIMGRKTFEEMSKLSLLSNRESIVFTRNYSLYSTPTAYNITFVSSLEQFFNLQLTNKKNIYMIGGREIAELFLKNNLLNTFLLTRLHKEYDGDTYFPLSLIEKWNITIITTNKNYTIYQYQPI